MSNQTLEIPSWDPVCVTILEWFRIGRYLRPYGGVVRHDAADGLQIGKTLWCAKSRGRRIGLCWSWREVLPRVVALSDPLGITSNVVLCDEEGLGLLAESRRLLYLNAAVNSLTWQAAALPEVSIDKPVRAARIRRATAPRAGSVSLR